MALATYEGKVHRIRGAGKTPLTTISLKSGTGRTGKTFQVPTKDLVRLGVHTGWESGDPIYLRIRYKRPGTTGRRTASARSEDIERITGY